MIFPFEAKISFALVIVILISGLLKFSFSYFPSQHKKEIDHPIALNAHPIKVRESTTELHIQVGEKLFVFGKAKGTLDKVKIGMHVLPFSQLPGTEGIESGFKSVTWKKLKDGSIQIQSAYFPWPATLTWTVLASGQLKMEAQGNLDGAPSNAIGLGFNLPQEHLKLINWNTKSQASGVWNNQQDGSGSSTPLYLPGLEKVNLTFESVALFIRAGTPNLILKVADISGKKTDDLSSDLSFYVSANEAEPIANEVESPSGLSFGIKNQPFGPKPMILWFEFH